MRRIVLLQKRIRKLNTRPLKKGRYILYWMQAAQRTEYNHALEYSIRKANDLKLPIVAVFGLCDNYPEANLRHYKFMLECLNQAITALEKQGIKFVIKQQSPEAAAIELSENASAVIVDAGHTRIQKKWRALAAKNIDCSFEEVETNLIVPVVEASGKEEYSAATFRPKIQARLNEYLVKMQNTKPQFDSLNLKFDGLDISSIDDVLSELNIDKTVRPVSVFKGGTSEAKKLLKNFIAEKLDHYADLRNDPSKDLTSNLSPYLHFGQISPLYIALKVSESKSPGKDAFLEELIVRRELSFNYVFYNNNYDKFSGLPRWAIHTLNVHTADTRPYLYSLKMLEKAQTHDPYWNAAQNQMLITGKMHGYMRMYWGKKILEWTKTPRQAFKVALYLNNKYELDGRDPNGFAGVAWCFGKHDRPWSSRQIFGNIRYMNADGLNRKFDADKYVEKISQLENQAQL